MGSNGSVPKVISKAAVCEHLMDDVVHCRELIQGLDVARNTILQSHRLNHTALIHLTAEIRSATQRLSGLIRQTQAVERDGQMLDLTYKEAT